MITNKWLKIEKKNRLAKRVLAAFMIDIFFTACFLFNFSHFLMIIANPGVLSLCQFPLGVCDVFGCRYEAVKRQWSHINDMFFIKNLNFDPLWLHFEGHGPY